MLTNINGEAELWPTTKEAAGIGLAWEGDVNGTTEEDPGIGVA